MKAVLFIMVFLVNGESASPSIATVEFNSMDACWRAAREIEPTIVQYSKSFVQVRCLSKD